MHAVLVIEDDAAIRRVLCDALRLAGYAPTSAESGEEGLRLAGREAFVLALLDVMLPGIDGFAVLEELRRVCPAMPVIFLTARGAEVDRVRGLRRGADDYVVKPFSTSELLARVEVVLRRTGDAGAGRRDTEIAGRAIDFARREARLPDGSQVQLSEREAAVLSYLVANRGRAVAREELLWKVWGVDPRGLHSRAVDMLITRLRLRLGDDPHEPRVIATVRGKGYMLG